MSPMHLIALAVSFLVTALPGAVQANLSGQMDLMFDSLVNVTSPTAHMGQRRGVLDAGSVVARSRIMNENLISFVPPSITAGCGGIDIIGGSISAISGDQFQQYLRTIAQNAAGYAFEVALQNMCKSCAETMNYLQRVTQAINQALGNSCQLAKGLVNAGADALNLAHKDKTSLATMTVGIGDAFESRSYIRGRSPEDDLQTRASDEAKKLKGNLVWRALKSGGVSGWFRNGDDHLLEVLMSVTGTLIIGDTEDSPDGRGKANRITPKGPLITISDVLHGPSTATGGRVQLYRCVPGGQDADGCLTVQTSAQGTGTEDPNFKGMIQRVRELMLGNPAAGQVGLLTKLRYMDYASGAVTDQEAAFMQALPVGAMLGNLARQNIGMATEFAEKAAPVIAVDLLVVMLRDMMKAVVAATTIQDSAYASVLQDQIRAARVQLDAEQQLLAARYGNTQSMMTYYATLMVQIRTRRYGTSGDVPNAQGVQQ